MFAIELTDEQLTSELAAMNPRVWRDAGYSELYITELATDKAKAKERDKREAEAQSHIDSLSEPQTREELAAYDAKHFSARGRFNEVEKTLTKKLNDFQKEQTGNVHRDSGRYSASNITQLDEEKRALRAELTECAWWRERLGSRVAHFDKLARKPAASKTQSKIVAGARMLREILTTTDPHVISDLDLNEIVAELQRGGMQPSECAAFQLLFQHLAWAALSEKKMEAA